MRLILGLVTLLINFNTYSRVQTCTDLHNAITVGLSDIEACVRTPYVENGFIPSGLHVTGKNIAYISMFHQDVRGDSKKNSIIAEIDINTRSVKKYTFPNKDQHSGLVVYQNYKKIVVPRGLEFCTYIKKSFMKKPRCQKQEIGSSKRINGFSFLFYGKDHLDKWHIWAGQYEDGKASADGIHIFGYEVIRGKINKKPSYRFYVPPRVTNIKGISVFPVKQRKEGYSKIVKAEYYLILSTSKGDNDSKIYSINYKRHEPYFYKFKIEETSVQNLYIAPHGLGSLHAVPAHKAVWALLESGTPFYEKKLEKDGLPFLFKIPYSQLDLK